jgi:hypothetical protein
MHQTAGGDAGFSDERPQTFLADEEPFVGEFEERLPNDRPTDTEDPAELRLGRNPISGAPTGWVDLTFQGLLDLNIKWHGTPAVDRSAQPRPSFLLSRSVGHGFGLS